MRAPLCAVVCLVVVGGLWGCRDPEAAQTQTRTGTISKIDEEARSATLEWTARDGSPRIREGRADASTDIRINGKSARLEDIRVGDRATVTMRWTSAEDLPVATMIDITRADDSAAGAGTQPGASG